MKTIHVINNLLVFEFCKQFIAIKYSQIFLNIGFKNEKCLYHVNVGIAPETILIIDLRKSINFFSLAAWKRQLKKRLHWVSLTNTYSWDKKM